MAHVLPVSVDANGHQVYEWEEQWNECGNWKSNKHTLVLEDDEYCAAWILARRRRGGISSWQRRRE